MAHRARAERRRAARGKLGPRRPLWLWVIVAAAVVGVAGGAIAAFLARPAVAPGEIVSEFMHIHGLEVPAWAPDELYVSTHEGLIHVDAEGVWRYVSEERHDFMGFAAHPTESGVLFSSGHPAPGSGLRNPIGFMASRDGGVTWESIALEGQVDFHAMAVYPGDGETIYGWNVAAAPGLYRSTDGGHDWEQLPEEGLAAAGGAFSLAVHPEDAGHVLAGTQDGLWRSVDGGASWEQVFAAGVPVTAVAFFPPEPDRIAFYAAGPDRGLLVLENGGSSVQRLDFVLPPDDAVFHIAIHPTDEAEMYLGTVREHLFRTRDGGGKLAANRHRRSAAVEMRVVVVPLQRARNDSIGLFSLSFD